MEVPVIALAELAELYLFECFARAECALTDMAQRVFVAEYGEATPAPEGSKTTDPLWLWRLKEDFKLTGMVRKYMQGKGEVWDMNTLGQITDKLLSFRAQYTLLRRFDAGRLQPLKTDVERAATFDIVWKADVYEAVGTGSRTRVSDG